MGDKNLTRKDFIKLSSATVAGLAIAPNYLYPQMEKKLDAKGLPTRQLGKTGISVPLLGLGCGSRFLAINNNAEMERLLNYALDHGVYYWDTAEGYEFDGKFSEDVLGRVLKNRRNEVWLSTKVRVRDGDRAKADIERSLKRLQTDYLDELKIHAVESLDDVDTIVKKGNVLSVIQKLKEEGVVRNIGFSGHSSAPAMKRMATEHEFDTMLIAMNHYREGANPFETTAVPAAANKDMGIIAMKVVRPREIVAGLAAEDLIKYALSLKHINCAILGTDSIATLKKNITLMKEFQPLDKERMEEIQFSLNPFFNHENVEWMLPNYQDGTWA